jgi:hypothetical protein
LALSCLVSAPAFACMNTMKEERLVKAKPSESPKAATPKVVVQPIAGVAAEPPKPAGEPMPGANTDIKPEMPAAVESHSALVGAAQPDRIATYMDQSTPERLASAPLVPALGLLCAGMLGTAAFLSARARADKARWEAIAE